MYRMSGSPFSVLMCSIALSVRMRRFAIAVARSLRAWRCGRGGGGRASEDAGSRRNGKHALQRATEKNRRGARERAGTRGVGPARAIARRDAPPRWRENRAQPLPRPRAPSARDPSRCCASLGSNRSRRSARAIPRRSPRDLSGARPRTRSTRGTRTSATVSFKYFESMLSVGMMPFAGERRSATRCVRERPDFRPLPLGYRPRPSVSWEKCGSG